MKISVCVPTYDRPEMTRQLIASFLAQNWADKEIIISDDTPNDSIERVAASFSSDSVKYFKNLDRLGYEANLRAALLRGTGDVLVVMGDDDVFAHPDALAKYADVFATNPSVVYAYCNQFQASADLSIERVFNTFRSDQRFERGERALRALWMTSLFIPGIGLRNGPWIDEFYPLSGLLFPQFELAGHLLFRGDGYGISEPLVAGRAHQGQLGFYILRGERKAGQERHASLETLEIAKRVLASNSASFDLSFIEEHMVQTVSFIFFKDKLVVSNKEIQCTYTQFCQASETAAKSKRLAVCAALAQAAPRGALALARAIDIARERWANRNSFQTAEQNIHMLCS